MTLQVKKNTAFRASVVLIDQADKFTGLTGVPKVDVTLRVHRESETVLSAINAYTWREFDYGLYQIEFGSQFATQLGRFSYVVTDNNLTDFLTFYGEAQVVDVLPGDIYSKVSGLNGSGPVIDFTPNFSAINSKVNYVSGQVRTRTTRAIYNELTDAKLDFVTGQVRTRSTRAIYNVVTGMNVTDLSTIDAKLDYVTGQVRTRSTRQIYNAVTGFNFSGDVVASLPVVQVGASYNGSTLYLSLGLEREGRAIVNPVSGAYDLYTQAGTFIASGNTVSADAQGVFLFSKVVSFTGDSVPYVHARVTDLSGTVTTRTYLPVVS
jgi:hypothetical protein